MEYRDLISNANLAFGGGQFELCLEYAKQAMAVDRDKADPHYAAGKAYMSLGRVGDAIASFENALELDKKNGNGYFLLGYAQAMAGNSAASLKSMTRALENKCEDSLAGQIYKIMAMINMEQKKYQDAMANLRQAEAYIGLEYEILQQKAACYASMNDYHQTLFVLNQMKLLQPREYLAYNLAFHVFMELGIYDEAKAELDRAKKYADFGMMYYNDCISYTMLRDPVKDTPDNIRDKWKETLEAIATALKEGLPTVEQVFDLYIRASQMYLSLGMPDEALHVLHAAEDPVNSHNNGFDIMGDVVFTEDAEEEIEGELTPEEEEERLEEQYEDGELDDLVEDIRDAIRDSDSDDVDEVLEELEEYLSPLNAVPKVEEVVERSILIGNFVKSDAQRDLHNSLFLSAYEQKKDYDNMLVKARELQTSGIVESQYCGIYYELKLGKLTGDEKWKRKYLDRINFWKRCMLENPTDYVAANYRIKSYIDIGDFENAEILCACMPAEIKKELQEEIDKARVQEV